MACTALEKSKECGFQVLPVSFDGHTTNAKCGKLLLIAINSMTYEKLTLKAQLRLKVSFEHEIEEHFSTFYLLRMIKTFRNKFF